MLLFQDIMKTEDYYKITPDKDGWRLLPSGDRIKLGDDATIAESATIGADVEIGARVIICYDAIINDSVKIGVGAEIGICSTIGHNSTIGDRTIIGNGVKIGNNINTGTGVIIDDGVVIGDNVKISDGIRIAEYTRIGRDQTTEKLNKYFISTYPEKSIFWKWVTKDFMSPMFGIGVPIKYEIGSTIEESFAEISDKQCDFGLHVFRVGIRPEFVGLCEADHSYVCLEVEVNREDICFGGLPGNSDKVRVKKLKVLGVIKKEI